MYTEMFNKYFYDKIGIYFFEGFYIIALANTSKFLVFSFSITAMSRTFASTYFNIKPFVGAFPMFTSLWSFF